MDIIFFKNIVGLLRKLNLSDWILFFTFLAIIWYSWETRQLRKWQKKQVQISILTLDMQRVKTGAETRINPTPYGEDFPTIVRKIYELGQFDPKVLYSRAFHQPLSIKDKILRWLENKVKKSKN